MLAYVNKWSILLKIRQVQIKITVRYNFTPIRLPSTKNSNNNNKLLASVGEDVEKCEPWDILLRVPSGIAPVAISMGVLQNSSC